MNQTSISDLKAKAKDQLLGNYGMATGSFALLFVLIYAIIMVIMSSMSVWFMKDAQAGADPGIMDQVLTQAVGIVIGIVSAVFSTGYIYLLYRISDRERPVMSDVFFVFRNHPDKVIIISIILTGVQFILLLPSMLVGTGRDATQLTGFDGRRFLLYIVLYLTGFIISFVFDLMLAMCYLIYIDDPEKSVGDIVKESISMMKGNKFRYFYMLLSFLGYWLLIILSLGIAALWVVPYQTMTTVEFYKDLAGKPENIEPKSYAEYMA